MTKEEAKISAELMLAYANGKGIEYFDEGNGKWYECVDPQFEWNKKYRIKTESKYRPFEDGNECWEEMKNHEPFGWICDHNNPNFKVYVLSVDNDGVMVSDYDDCAIFLNYSTLFDHYVFVDETQIGIKAIF